MMLELLVGDGHGQYCPQVALSILDRDLLEQLPYEDVLEVLNGPESEWYWDAWSNIENVPMKYDGEEVYLCMNGDIWIGTVGGLQDLFEA